MPRWRTVVWDDPVNLMSYVTAVFREYFGYSTSRAEELMMAVHTRGRATVSTGVRERVEADVMAIALLRFARHHRRGQGLTPWKPSPIATAASPRR